MEQTAGDASLVEGTLPEQALEKANLIHPSLFNHLQFLPLPSRQVQASQNNSGDLFFSEWMEACL